MKNYSRQREEVIKFIKSSYSHPTAEDVYVAVKTKDPAVSRSTVYRNLGLLVESAIINKITMSVGPDRYDYVREPHNHVICSKCGCITDFCYGFEYEEMKKSILEQTGIEISDGGITLEGICNSCKK